MVPFLTPCRCSEAALLDAAATGPPRTTRGSGATARRARIAGRKEARLFRRLHGAVVLTGFMGSGKTAVGKRVALRLRCRFVDTDALIEKREGRSIASIFATDGEAYFRAREREVVAEFATGEDIVIATGGGTLVDERNFRTLHAAGTVICLTASPETILRRTPGDGRPLLQRADRMDRIRVLLAERASAYARAPYTIDTSGLTVNQVVDRILDLLTRTDRPKRSER